MTEYLPGIVAIALTVVLVPAAIIFNRWRLASRWETHWVLHKTLQNVEPAEFFRIRAEVKLALEVIDDDRLNVEVCEPGYVQTPTVNGRFPDGSLVGGSIRVEGGELAPSYLVAVVAWDDAQPLHTAGLIVHEYARHIRPLLERGTPDAKHDLGEYALLETTLKENLRRPPAQRFEGFAGP